MLEIKESQNKSMPESKGKFDKVCGSCAEQFKTDDYYATFCSPKCKETAQTKYFKERAEKEIKAVIPIKYQSIECDRKDLMDEYKNMNLFITGEAGVGKTVLMASIAKNLILKNKAVKWISYPAFIMELQDRFKRDRVEGMNRIDTPFELAEKIAMFNGWLCIDDIGAEKLTDYVRQITYFIINEREQRMLPLIMTSNFSLAHIDQMIDPRVSSRIAGICENIRLTGKDRRLRT